MALGPVDSAQMESDGGLTFSRRLTREVRREQRLLMLLFLAVDLIIFSIGLRAGAVLVIDNLPDLSMLLLHRDRIACLAIFALTASALGCYHTERISDRFDSVYYTLVALGLSVLFILALASLLPDGIRVLSRRELLVSIPVTAVLISAWRHFGTGFLARFRSMHRRFHVLGSPGEGQRIAYTINQDRSLHAKASYITFEALVDRCNNRPAAIGEYWRVPEDVIIEVDAENREDLPDILHFCEEHFHRVFLYPHLDDLLLFEQGAMIAVAGIPLIEVNSARYQPYIYVKRAMDVVISAAMLAVALPFCPFIAAAVKLSSPGPVLYRQRRVGMNGREFDLYKFRSMYVHMTATDAAGHKLAEKDDPRITPIGRRIRLHRIDEIPQLWSVLKGDMSLIGPRPVWKEFYDAQRESLPLFDMRLAVRPGLTSLSHVLGSYSSDPQDRLRYDLVYINSLSFMTDMRILLETVRIVLSGKGAQ